MDKQNINTANWFMDQLNLYQSANSDKESIKNNFIIRKIEFELIMGGKDWMTNLSEKGQRRAVLETEKISLDNVPNSEFDVPRGLAQAKSMTRIIVGDTEKMEKTGVGDLFHF